MPGAGPRTPSSLGLPEQVRACLFDLDGVLTETAKVHAAAWKEMFDAFLKARADKGGEPFVAFDEADYDSYVDGKTRADGTRSFLGSVRYLRAVVSAGQAEVLRAHGADIVVNDLVELLERP